MKTSSLSLVLFYFPFVTAFSLYKTQLAMSPRDYIRARSSSSLEEIIDGKPYLPEMVVTDERSAKQAVASILNVDTSNFETTPVRGGNTNQLIRVFNDQSAYLVRIFGAEGMIDRDIENSMFAALALEQIAPQYYGRFANGRIEEWKHHMRPLQTREMALSAPNIAQALGKVHAYEIPPHLKEYYPLEPGLWKQLEEWYQQALNSQFKTKADTERVEGLKLERFRAELDWLRNQVVPKDAKIVFCHNDALGGNILYNEDTQEIQLIDFEYGGINFQAFDIANHFNEYAGGTDNGGRPNYEWFPNEEQQKSFIKHYLEATSSSVSDEATDRLYSEVQGFVLVNHLYWSFWAINSAALEGCDSFDYLLYASIRLEEYFRLKSDVK